MTGSTFWYDWRTHQM